MKRLFLILTLVLWYGGVSAATTYYEALNVQPNASIDEIKKAFKKLSKQYHPDFHQNEIDKKEFYDNKMADLNEAYSVLTDEYSRRIYDQSLGPNTIFSNEPRRTRPLRDVVKEIKEMFKDTFYFDKETNEFVDKYTEMRFKYDLNYKKWLSQLEYPRYEFSPIPNRGIIYDRLKKAAFIPPISKMRGWKFNDPLGWFQGWIYKRSQPQEKLLQLTGNAQSQTPNINESKDQSDKLYEVVRNKIIEEIATKKIDLATAAKWLSFPQSVSEPKQDILTSVVIETHFQAISDKDVSGIPLAFLNDHWLEDTRAIDAVRFLLRIIKEGSPKDKSPSLICESLFL